MTRREVPADDQWAQVAPFVTGEPAHGGRPRVDGRAALNGMPWGLRSGARWVDSLDR